MDNEPWMTQSMSDIEVNIFCFLLMNYSNSVYRTNRVSVETFSAACLVTARCILPMQPHLNPHTPQLF